MPFQGPSTPQIRDSRVDAHQAALDSRRRGDLVDALVETSLTVANVLVLQHAAAPYSAARTINYLTKVADTQLATPGMDGLGSASGAAEFGVREFCRQDSAQPRKAWREWVITWRHTTRTRGRPNHIAADGTTVGPNESFDVTPGIGSPGCGCYIEATEVKSPVLTRPAPRVSVRGEPNRRLSRQVRVRSQGIADDLARQFNTQSRWNGKIAVGRQARGPVARKEAAGSMNWDGTMNLSFNVETKLADGDLLGTKVFVHEVAHSYSQVTQSQYASGGVSAEEGAAECFARAYMQQSYGIPFEQWKVYDIYVKEFETYRVAAGVSEAGRLTWYRDILNLDRQGRIDLFRHLAEVS